MIDTALDVVRMGADTDDPEAPINHVYDHRLFCGGFECANRPARISLFQVYKPTQVWEGDTLTHGKKVVAIYDNPDAARKLAIDHNRKYVHWYSGGVPMHVERTVGYRDREQVVVGA